MEVMMSFSGQAAYRFSLATGFQRPASMPLAIRTDEGIQALRPADGPGGSAAGTQAPAGTQAVSAPTVQPVPDTVPAEGTSPDANPPASAAVAAPAETAEPEAETSPQAAEADAAGAALVRQQSFSLSRSTSLQIRTREGDLVTIELSLSVDRSQTLAAAGNGDTTVLSYSGRRSVDLSMSFSIEGNLNEEERKAIGDLLHRIDKVTDKFYDGKVDAAFARLGKMEIDAEAIAGYSLSLEQTVSRQALTAYAAAAGTAATTATTSPAQVAGDYASEVRSLMAQPPQPLPFAETRSAVSELFSNILEAKAAEQPEPPEGHELLEALLERLESEDGEDD